MASVGQPIPPAEPDRAVVATVGDGGLKMFLGELATLRDLALAIPILVFADAQLGPIELKQRTSQPPNLAADFRATDFPAVARALARDRFTIIAAEVGRQAYDGRI